MNAKKITSLVLAAVMAAGTTVTAFADVQGSGSTTPDADRPLTFYDDTIYEEKDGVLTPSTDFQPGDTLYIRLNEDEDAETKDKNRFNVYADWKIGEDMVEDIDIVYRKGEYSDTNNQWYYSYTVKGISGVNVEVEIESDTELTKAQLIEELKKNSEVKAYINGAYAKVGAYVGTTFYRDSDVVGFLTANNWHVLGSDKTGTISGASDGYGSYDTTPGSGDTLTANSNIYVDPDADATSGKFVDISKITTISALKETGLITFDLGTDYYDNSGAHWDLDDLIAHEFDLDAALNSESTVSGGSKEYTYWVKIDTKDDDTTKVLDLAGSLYIGTSRSKAENANNYYDLDTSMDNRVPDYAVKVEDEYTFEADSRAVVKFSDDAEDVVLYFGENEAAWYEFDARGQSALNFAFTLDFNREIADLFPNANIDFISWTAEPSTNRTGDLYITADPDTFIYEVTENGVKEIANAEYDEDEEAWHIRTRKLTSYAISDRELDTSITLDGENSGSSNTGSSSTDGGKDNPDTGR